MDSIKRWEIIDSALWLVLSFFVFIDCTDEDFKDVSIQTNA